MFWQWVQQYFLSLNERKMLNETQIRAKYGAPGDIKNLTSIALPYRMRIAWDLKSTVKAIQCHKLIAEPLTAVFNDLLGHYGFGEIQSLGIDLFGGCYNFRKMRGGNSWSRHSWAIAIDLDPERNGLQTPWLQSQFSKPEYKEMMNIFYQHGFFNLGKERGNDAMHFERAS